MTVNKFKVGDGIVIYGWQGTVIDIQHVITADNLKCTYLQIAFDEPQKVGYQYHNGWYGGLDDVVAYGYIEK